MRVRSIAVAACAVALAHAAQAEGTDEHTLISAKTVTVIVEGPPGPYPKGHAEIVVTLYDAQAADPEAQSAVLATQSKRLPLLGLPQTFEIEADPGRLSAAEAPSATAFIMITRRPAYVSKTPAALSSNGPTRVSVDSIDEPRAK